MTLDELRRSPAAVLSIAQTCTVLADVSGEAPDPRTVRRAAETGQLPAIRIGKRILIVRERLVDMLSAEPAV